MSVFRKINIRTEINTCKALFKWVCFKRKESREIPWEGILCFFDLLVDCRRKGIIGQSDSQEGHTGGILSDPHFLLSTQNKQHLCGGENMDS